MIRLDAATVLLQWAVGGLASAARDREEEVRMGLVPAALDGGDESEIAGLYLIDPEGKPWRLGYALGNEYSDHVMERQNYLYLAHSKLRACASITIGVNLDASLRPIQATLLSVNENPFTGQSLLNKLFGIQKDQEGIAPLHSVPQRTVEGPYALPIASDLGWAMEPMMVPLFADLAKVLEKTTLPIAEQLGQYAEIQGQLFTGLRQSLIFYLGAVRFIQLFQKLGLPMCRPQIAPAEHLAGHGGRRAALFLAPSMRPQNLSSASADSLLQAFQSRSRICRIGYSPCLLLKASRSACSYDSSDAADGGQAPIRCRNATILPK